MLQCSYYHHSVLLIKARPAKMEQATLGQPSECHTDTIYVYDSIATTVYIVQYRNVCSYVFQCIHLCKYFNIIKALSHSSLCHWDHHCVTFTYVPKVVLKFSYTIFLDTTENFLFQLYKLNIFNVILHIMGLEYFLQFTSHFYMHPHLNCQPTL